MLALAASFSDVILAVHILAVVIAFGVVFSYPIFFLVGARLDPRAMPWFHRVQREIGRRLITPGLVVVLAAGIYLASDQHQWHAFYVQWGVAAVVVIGALEGAFMVPNLDKLAQLAQRDVAGAAVGAATMAWSPEYESQLRRVGLAGAFLALVVVSTVVLMTLHVGGS